jgi:hypothetical protein
LSTKLKLSAFFLFGFFFFRITGPILTGKMKDFHIENNTKLVERAPWIFKIFDVFYKGAAIMCLVFIVMIWTGFVTIPNE